MGAAIPSTDKTESLFRVLAISIQRQKGLFERLFPGLKEHVLSIPGLASKWESSPTTVAIALFYLINSVYYTARSKDIGAIIAVARKFKDKGFDTSVTPEDVENLVALIQEGECKNHVFKEMVKLSPSGELVALKYCVNCYFSEVETIERDAPIVEKNVVPIQPFLELLSAMTGYPLELFGLQDLFEELLLRTRRWVELLGDIVEFYILVRSTYKDAGLDGEASRVDDEIAIVKGKWEGARERFPELDDERGTDNYRNVLDFINALMEKIHHKFQSEDEMGRIAGGVELFYDTSKLYHRIPKETETIKHLLKAWKVPFPASFVTAEVKEAVRKAFRALPLEREDERLYFPGDELHLPGIEGERATWLQERFDSLEVMHVVFYCSSHVVKDAITVIACRLAEVFIKKYLEGLPVDVHGKMDIEKIIVLFVHAHHLTYFPSKLSDKTINQYLHVMKKSPEGKRFPLPDAFNTWEVLNKKICGRLHARHAHEVVQIRGYLDTVHEVDWCKYCKHVFTKRVVESFFGETINDDALEVLDAIENWPFISDKELAVEFDESFYWVKEQLRQLEKAWKITKIRLLDVSGSGEVEKRFVHVSRDNLDKVKVARFIEEDQVMHGIVDAIASRTLLPRDEAGTMFDLSDPVVESRLNALLDAGVIHETTWKQGKMLGISKEFEGVIRGHSE